MTALDMNRPPSLTTAQRDAVASPEVGDQIFNATTGRINVWNGTGWDELAATATESVPLGRYNSRGMVVFDPSAGKSVFPISTATDSEVIDAGAFFAAEHDPGAWRSGDVITIPKDGRYRLSGSLTHGGNDIGGGAAAQAANSMDFVGARIDRGGVVTDEWLAEDTQGGISDDFNWDTFYEFSAGNTLSLIINTDGSEANEAYSYQLNIEEYADGILVDPNLVTPDPLEYLTVTRPYNETGHQSFTFNGLTYALGEVVDLTLGATEENTGGFTVGNADITVISDGRYRVHFVANLTDNSNVTRIATHLGINGAGVREGVSTIEGSSADQIEVEYVGLLVAGDVLDFRAGTNDGNTEFLSGWTVSVQQLPTATVALIDNGTPVDDQSASGYFDIGTMRLQWGRATTPGAGIVSVVYPAPFADTSYALTATAANGNNVSMMYEADSTTGANVLARDPAGGAVSTSFSWQAIGLKP